MPAKRLITVFQLFDSENHGAATIFQMFYSESYGPSTMFQMLRNESHGLVAIFIRFKTKAVDQQPLFSCFTQSHCLAAISYYKTNEII